MAEVLEEKPARRNRYGRSEWAGAFGDLGTLIPFVLAYVSLLGLDPAALLLCFGAAQIASGLWYRSPIPVQPMKAIGTAATTQAVHGYAITAGAVYASGVITGVVWLVLGATGLAHRLARLTPRTVVSGLVLGLGFRFMVDGLGMMGQSWWLAGAGLALALVLHHNRRFPAMFALLLLGLAAAFLQHPDLIQRLPAPHPGLPGWHLGGLTGSEWLVGGLLLALPQLPLTLGNALIAVSAEHNRLFPDRPVSERRLALSTGLMNLLAPALGGVPMCHGAGGLAGHVRFGARTGGSLVILGSLLVCLSLLFGSALTPLLELLPGAVLGVILFLAGTELALGIPRFGETRAERTVVVVTAALTLWNVGAAFVVGIALSRLQRRD